MHLCLFSDKKISREDDKTITKTAELESIVDRLEKIAEIPSDCTYANDQAVDKEVSRKTFLILKRPWWIAYMSDLRTCFLRQVLKAIQNN